MNKRIEVTVTANPDADDCLADAVETYTEEHPDLNGWDLSPRWADEGDRSEIVLSVPAWAVEGQVAS